LSSRGTSVFPLQIGMYAAFIYVNTFFRRNSVEPLYKFRAFFFGFFIIGKGLFFRVI
jgi:hypothetical protein